MLGVVDRGGREEEDADVDSLEGILGMPDAELLRDNIGGPAATDSKC